MCLVLTITGTPRVNGTVDPVEAKIWLREIKKTFEIVGAEEDKKTILDAYMLNGETNYWWEAKQVLEESGVISWTRDKVIIRKVSSQKSRESNKAQISRAQVREYVSG